MSDILFEVKEDNLDTGLRGFPVGTCHTSSVDPLKGLFYSGIPCDKLVDNSAEEVIYLLLNGVLPDASKLKVFKEDLQKRSYLSQKTIEAIQQLPKNGHPMALFSVAIQLLGIFEGKGDYFEDALALMAKIGLLTAHLIAHVRGEPLRQASNPAKGLVENFVSMVSMSDAQEKALLEPLRLFNILHFDHGGGNLSTFVGKAIASSLADLYSSMAGAMNALAGPRHGRANQDAIEFIQKTLLAVGRGASLEQVEAYCHQLIQEGGLLYGFGHAVLMVEDPRATIFYALSKKLVPEDPLIEMAHKLRAVVPKVLLKNAKVRDPYPNVDAISGALLYAAGFQHPEFFTLLFGWSRTVGIAIQILDERTKFREGKGTPLMRPKYIYKTRGVT